MAHNGQEFAFGVVCSNRRFLGRIELFLVQMGLHVASNAVCDGADNRVQDAVVFRLFEGAPVDDETRHSGFRIKARKGHGTHS